MSGIPSCVSYHHDMSNNTQHKRANSEENADISWLISLGSVIGQSDGLNSAPAINTAHLLHITQAVQKWKKLCSIVRRLSYLYHAI